MRSGSIEAEALERADMSSMVNVSPQREFLRTIRSTARAVIWQGEKVLVQVKQSADGGIYLTLPGGRLEPGESLADATCREVFEEVGAEVDVLGLRHVAELYKDRPEGLRHQVEHLFDCKLKAPYSPHMGPHPDSKQINVRWADPVAEADLFDPPYGTVLTEARGMVYLGIVQDQG